MQLRCNECCCCCCVHFDCFKLAQMKTAGHCCAYKKKQKQNVPREKAPYSTIVPESVQITQMRSKYILRAMMFILNRELTSFTVT